MKKTSVAKVLYDFILMLGGATTGALLALYYEKSIPTFLPPLILLPAWIIVFLVFLWFALRVQRYTDQLAEQESSQQKISDNQTK